MLVYQPIEELISVLKHCNTLTTNNHHSNDENHMINHSSSQAVFHKKINTYKKKVAVSFTQTLNTIMVTHKKCNKH